MSVRTKAQPVISPRYLLKQDGREFIVYANSRIEAGQRFADATGLTVGPVGFRRAGHYDYTKNLLVEGDVTIAAL
jgi:hypothetical protein